MLSSQDEKDLRRLENGHYAEAGLLLFMTAFTWVFLYNLAPLFERAESGSFNGSFFRWMLGLALLWGLLGVLASVGSVYLMRVRKHPGVLAALSAVKCLYMPTGTVLGVLTILVVRRPSVHAAFTGETHEPPPAAEPPADPPPPLSADDLNQLRSLVTGHRLVGGITALFALIPVLHLFAGIAMLTSPPSGGAQEQAVLRTMGMLFVAIALFVMVTTAILAVATFRAGGFVQRRIRWTYCVVVNAIQCACFPFGTVLGVFSLIVLNRDRVRRAFQPAP